MLNQIFSQLVLFGRQGRAQNLAVIAVSGIATWIVLLLIGPLFVPLPASRPEIATIVLITTLIHEVGHWYAFRRFGVSAQIVFLVILGGAVADKNDADRMTRNQQLTVALAGVAGNLAIGIVCFLLYLPGLIEPATWSNWALTQGALILLNLIPFPGLDGGRFLEYFLNPRNVPFEKTLVQRMIGAITGVFVFFYLMSGLLVMPHELLFIGAWLWRSDPARVKRLNIPAIPHKYRPQWAGIYVGLVAASMLLIWSSTF